MEKELVLVGLSVLLVTFISLEVQAQVNRPLQENITWCRASVSQFDSWDQQERGIYYVTQLPTDANCTCYPSDYLYTGQWENLYCNGAGKLVQERTVKKKIKPACKDWKWEVEKREIDYAPCKRCPPSNVLSSWTLAGCENNTKIYKRNIEGYVFNPLLTKCFKQNYVEYKFEKTKSCKNINTELNVLVDIKEKGGQKVMPSSHAITFPQTTAIILLGFVFVVFVSWIRERRKKVKK